MPKKTSRHSRLEDGDVEKVERDGKQVLVVKAQHLVDDYEKIMDDPRVFFKIINSKKNSEKGEVLAEMFGFKGDDLLSPGRKMEKVMDLYLKAKTAKEKEAVAEKYFPEQMLDEDAEWNVEIDIDGTKKSVVENSEPEAEKLTEDDVKMVIKLWKAETDVPIKVDEAFANPELVQVYESVKFDPETGEKLTEEDRIMMAMDSIYGDYAPETKDIEPGGNKRGATKQVIPTEKKAKTPKKYPTGVSVNSGDYLFDN